MGKRSAIAHTEEEVVQLTLAQLNQQIAWLEWRLAVSNSQLRKGALKHLVWLETQREKLHKVPAPKRRRI